MTVWNSGGSSCEKTPRHGKRRPENGPPPRYTKAGDGVEQRGVPRARKPRATAKEGPKTHPPPLHESRRRCGTAGGPSCEKTPRHGKRRPEKKGPSHRSMLVFA